MKEIIKKNRFILIVMLICAVSVAAYSLYKTRSTKLLDKASFNEFRTSLKEAADTSNGGFESQDDLRAFIIKWADDKGLEYKVDRAGSIIFDRSPAKRKKNVSPTLICVNMNYETASDNAALLASAASVALSDIESGRRTVIFADDEQNLAGGYRNLTKKYVTSKTKIIYLDYGSSSYLSKSSFQERFADIKVPAKREDLVGDTAVTIKISGIKSVVAGPGIGNQPDPVSAFSSLLTRLKSKSVTYRLGDIKVGSNGNMTPVSLEATVLLNSYSVRSFTSYIDKKIKEWEKDYDIDNNNIEFTYEVTDDPDELPDKVYTASTADKLAGVLYTIKSGTYKYSENDAIPEGKKAGDTYGINCILDIKPTDSSIAVKLMTQGYSDSFTDRIMYDNTAAAELYGCKYKETSRVNAFRNDRDSLSRTFKKTYNKVNDTTSADSSLREQSDNYFTPCSYLADVNAKADIIHLRINRSNATRITNTLLCYIKTKGNTSFFK